MITIQVADGLIIRSFLETDAAALFTTVNGCRQHLRKWLAWVDATTKDEHSLQFIRESLQQIENQEAIALGIFQEDILCGGVGMHNWDRHLNKAEIGYWLSQDVQGKGIATNSVKAFISWLFRQVDLHKVEIHFAPMNKQSAALAERLGAKVEGIIRDGLIMNGQYTDRVITGLLKAEWQG